MALIVQFMVFLHNLSACLLFSSLEQSYSSAKLAIV